MTNLRSPNFLVTPAKSIEGAKLASGNRHLVSFCIVTKFARTMPEQHQPMLSSKWKTSGHVLEFHQSIARIPLENRESIL